MRLVFTENVHALALPPGHKFPLGKYDALHAELAAEFPERMTLGPRATIEDVLLVHDAAYVAGVQAGTLGAAAVRRLGFPWSESLVTRSLRSVGGTLSALAWAMELGAAGHIAGGTHHAFRDRGEGFCVFNDIAVAIAVARRDHGVRRALVVDLDVHQGNGTAAIFAADPDVFTLSVHAAHNYPFRKERSTLDVELADGCADTSYLAALDAALERASAFRPDVVFFQAGVDGLAGDRLGRMALTHEGLAARDARVLRFARARGTPLVATLGGGYHKDIGQSVRAHAGVYRALMHAYA